VQFSSFFVVVVFFFRGLIVIAAEALEHLNRHFRSYL